MCLVYHFRNVLRCETRSWAKGEGRTKLLLVLLLSSSGMGKYTARATQFAKMASRIMISKGLGVIHWKKTKWEKTWIKYEQYGDNFPATGVRILPLHNTEASLAERIPQRQEEERACRPWVAACGHQLLQLLLLFPLQCVLVHDVGGQRRAVAVHHCRLQRKTPSKFTLN